MGRFYFTNALTLEKFGTDFNRNVWRAFLCGFLIEPECLNRCWESLHQQIISAVKEQSAASESLVKIIYRLTFCNAIENIDIPE